MRFQVLKPSRILRRTTNNNNDNDKDFQHTSPIKEHKIDPIDKMMITTTIDGNQDAIANLPSTLQETNNNERTLSATVKDDDDDDDDDATIQTSNSTKAKQACKSYNIKLLLTSKHGTSNSALQHAMLTILETIDRKMGTDVKIFDGVKQQVTDFQVQSVTTF
jgi:hypothetical protein